MIYAIGGFDGSTYLKTVEAYDPEASSWKIAGSMMFRRLGGGVGVLKVQKDSILLKPNSTNVDSKKINSNQRSSLFNHAPIINHNANVSPIVSNTQVSSSPSPPWPYNSLPSLLANVPTSSNLPTNSSFNNASNPTSASSESMPSEFSFYNNSSASISSPTSNSSTATASSAQSSSNNNSNKLVDI